MKIKYERYKDRRTIRKIGPIEAAAAHGERLKEILAKINQINILLIKNCQHA